MNFKKKILIITLLIAIFPKISFAENSTFKVTVDGKDTSVVEDTLTSTTDYSNMNVLVYEDADGGKRLIYEGLLGEYDNGAWSNVDFGQIDILFIFNWDSEYMVYVQPVRTSANTNNQSTTNTTTNNQQQYLSDNSSSLTIASQIRINGVNVGENGMRIIDNANLACHFAITNNSITPQKMSVILATYTENKTLYQVKMINTPSITPGNTENVQIAYKFNTGKEYSGKLMFWNAGMVPFRTTIDFTQTNGINAYYYNADNRLLQVDKANNTSIYYTYDNMGNLLTKTLRGAE